MDTQQDAPRSVKLRDCVVVGMICDPSCPKCGHEFTYEGRTLLDVTVEVSMEILEVLSKPGYMTPVYSRK